MKRFSRSLTILAISASVLGTIVLAPRASGQDVQNADYFHRVAHINNKH